MSSPACTNAIPAATLTSYWLGELAAAQELDLEEHLFGCAHCNGRLGAIVKLAEGIRQATREGRFQAVLSPAFIRRLQDDGLRIREYRMQPGGSVACTVAPHDDLVVAHLHAPLQDVQRLDVVYHELPSGTQGRLQDVAFDPGADEIVLAPNVVDLRLLVTATQRVQLISVEGDAEREIGTYTFNHSRYRE